MCVVFVSANSRARDIFPELKNQVGNNMYYDILTRIQNGLSRKYERIKVPYSKFDMAILESLAKQGYVEQVQRKGRGVKRIIEVKLKYGNEGAPTISGVKFFSKSSRRLYCGYRDMKRSHQGFGHYFFSTPKGVLTNKEARKEKVGGEILFEIW